ncbi:hypothetical protein [Butyrivibrio sp. NC3005]|uniref:hypothetical protein n=1 Tax=Butyrivibrio sp. NC3005 TaxID=1280685 RepID=UPI00040DBF06|nr:hypothetical protein [Butyrivibrio sp. NC3005]
MKNYFKLSQSKRYLVTCFFIITLLLSGCKKKNSELETYRQNMESFFVNIATYNEAINNIDATKDDATAQLLTQLDNLNAEFTKMAGYSVPEDFHAAASLATEAADYMNKANVSFHEAYDGEYNADSESQAKEYYARANTRVKYMISILHGQIPSGEGVSITTKNAKDFTPVDDQNMTSPEENGDE